ncbi:MAG: hypothetical protein FJ317_00215 [SAR202 cluster bacterium]|nr:hypothetical protein [SAR202 cluster bacterium]
MQRLPKSEAFVYEFDHRHTPKLRVKQGETFVVETNDALAGAIRTPDAMKTLHKLPALQFTPPKGNPCGGPVYIEGAERGDVLEITIEKIVVEDQGFTGSFPGIGPLHDSARWKEARGPFVHIIKHLPGPSGTTRDGKGVLNSKVSWDLQPMIGTIATAPDRKVETTTDGQGPSGGNLDIRDVKEGTKVYLNVYHPGALLYVGDLHGSQGDTEFYGQADETGGEVTLTCRVIKNKKLPFMRLVKADSIVSVFCGRPLEVAVETAIINLMEWMVTEYGVSERDAYIHTCVNPEFRVNVYQMLKAGKLEFTAGAEIPKKYLLPSP